MKQWLRTILLVVFSLTFLISGYFLLDYYLESRKQKTEFDALAQIMDQAIQNPPAPQSPEPKPTDPGSPDLPEEAPTEPAAPALLEVKDPETGESVWLLPEFADLYQMNNDIVGWISIPGTLINYPVMQTKNSVYYYLYRNFSTEYSNHGCIYVREACDVFTPSDNVTIYGHRMGDGTMFNALHNYASEDFYKEHSQIIFNTLTENHTYEILSIFRISSSVGSDFPYHLYVDFADEAHFNEFVENCYSRALYDTGVTATYGDKLITLSTCEYTRVNGRLVVVAKRID